MIIGEHGLIIGKMNIIISDLSISCFFHFIKEVNYIVKKYISIIYKITEKNNSPPKTIIK